jgi:hypothetical protein
MSRVSQPINKLLVVVVLVGLLLAACAPRGAQPGNPGAAQVDTGAKADLRVKVVGLLEALSPEAATIDGTQLAINANTIMDAGVQTNQMVEAQTVFGTGGLAALVIRPAGPDRTAGQTFELTGVVQSQSETAWVVGGHTVQVNSGTELTSSPAVGDLVQVQGTTNLAGTLLAREIQPAGTAAAGAEIEFSGVVTSLGASTWVIGGQSVQVSAQTEIKPGVALGAFVKVHALPQTDGSLLAREIELDVATPTAPAPGTGEQEFTGTLTAIQGDLWTIGGETVRITAGTEVKGTLQVGDVVKVHATLGSDGVLVAREVELAAGDDGEDDNQNDGDEHQGDEQEFTGTLTAMNGDLWTVDSMQVRITSDTEVKDTLQVGDEVKVHAAAGSDGVLVAREIELAGDDDLNDDRSGDDSGHDANDDQGGSGGDDSSGSGSVDAGDGHSGSGGGDDSGGDDSGGDDHSGSGGGDDDHGGDDQGGSGGGDDGGGSGGGGGGDD